MPELSSEMPISFSEQHIPFDINPASGRGAISISPNFAPTFANAVFIPTLTFGAPQTTSTSSASPISTLRRWSFSDFGWSSIDLISATTIPLKSLPLKKISFSTSAVESENLRINSILSRPVRSTKSLIQFIDKNIIYSSFLNFRRL